jgi:hypothetical protein
MYRATGWTECVPLVRRVFDMLFSEPDERSPAALARRLAELRQALAAYTDQGNKLLVPRSTIAPR